MIGSWRLRTLKSLHRCWSDEGLLVGSNRYKAEHRVQECGAQGRGYREDGGMVLMIRCAVFDTK